MQILYRTVPRLHGLTSHPRDCFIAVTSFQIHDESIISMIEVARRTVPRLPTVEIHHVLTTTGRDIEPTAIFRVGSVRLLRTQVLPCTVTAILAVKYRRSLSGCTSILWTLVYKDMNGVI